MSNFNWLPLFLVFFVIVSIINSLLACSLSSYHAKTPTGRLTHSQLRIKQGNATIEQRINVFAMTVVFGFTNIKLYLIAAAFTATVVFFNAFS